jgi:hypothetical protein
VRGHFKPSLILLAFPLMLVLCEAARACTCGGWPTTCQAYASAEAVFVGTVTSVEVLNPRKDEAGELVGDGQLARVNVEQVFKNMKQTEVVFRTENSTCDAVYKEGQRWLFYAYYDKKARVWLTHSCDRSTLVEGAADDLLYLQGLPASAQTTRLTVTLKHYEDEPEQGFKRIENLNGVKVRVIGAAKTYEVYTNAEGLAVAEGIPPGSYAVEPDVPKGLKLRFPIYFGSVEYPPDKPSDKQPDNRAPKLVLEAKDCASVSFIYSADTSISGRLLGTDGRPLPNVCLALMPADRVVRDNWNFDCTDAQGRYELTEIPPGQYVIVINDDDKISSYAPFHRAFYPGVFERERAGVLTLIQGSNLKDLDIYIPAQEPTRVIQGVLLYSDGKPAAKVHVKFKADSVRDGYDGETGTDTDERGRFSLTVLQGLKGVLYGSMYTYSGEFQNCPQLEKILKTMNDRVPELQTKPVRVEVNTDMQEIRLTFPFPYCVKARRE